MSVRLLSLLAVLVIFSALSIVALLDVGYLGLLLPQFQSWGGRQVLADLVILALLACAWMVTDARARGLSAWPFVALTLVGGSFGVLVYLVVREVAARREGASAETAGSRPAPMRMA